jgi:hypothetical protein
MNGFLAIFYVDDAYFASHDPVFHQLALSIRVNIFEHVGLETNFLKMHAMICTPSRIQTQLLLPTTACTSAIR